tara:strand:+ start:1542 stop:1754 length:213 start_codon:yes stop_codon:yes gene_type:complete
MTESHQSDAVKKYRHSTKALTDNELLLALAFYREFRDLAAIGGSSYKIVYDDAVFHEGRLKEWAVSRGIL